MDQTLVVRHAQPADLDQVARLAARLVRLHHQWDPRRFMVLEPVEEGYRRFLAAQLEDSEVLVLVAAKGPRIIGYVYGGLEGRDWATLRDRCGAVHDLYVDQETRHEGVATALIEAALAQLKAMGAPRVVLHSAQANAEGQRLFLKLGFRRTMVEMTREL